MQVLNKGSVWLSFPSASGSDMVKRIKKCFLSIDFFWLLFQFSKMIALKWYFAWFLSFWHLRWGPHSPCPRIFFLGSNWTARPAQALPSPGPGQVNCRMSRWSSQSLRCECNGEVWHWGRTENWILNLEHLGQQRRLPCVPQAELLLSFSSHLMDVLVAIFP